ncbi:Maf/Ham1 [Thozetella sp. PMI_491]|nr:Maf/Ham1 [Thozetella sp. PMI_491]
MAPTDTGNEEQAHPQVVVVASQNPVKIKAALKGFTSMFPGSTYTTVGVSVPSGVPDQPMSDDETLQGALNRIRNAREAKPGADFYIGLEGGLHTEGSCFQSFAWIAVEDKAGRKGKARSATYYLPEEVSKLVRGGMELGHADDVVFGRSNSKQVNGSTGILTDDAVDRSTFYEQAVILALIPFKNPTLTF